MTRTYIHILSLLSACVLVGACGSSVQGPTKKTSVRSGSKYSYEYTENACSTGRHTFYTLDAYCTALEDDDLNHQCASTMRQEAHHNHCR